MIAMHTDSVVPVPSVPGFALAVRSLLAAFALAGFCGCSKSDADRPLRPFLGINEDNDRYFLAASKNPSALTEEGVRSYFDSVAEGGAVTHFFMCVNGQRTSYASKVWEPIWLGLNDRNEHGKTNDRWCVNAKILHDRGIDPWRIWCQRAREKGVSPWISMRMNDGHYATFDYKVHRNETFWWERRDLWRKPKGPYMCDRVFDFSKPEVQEHAFALVKEIVSRWDLDGLELDWLRQVHCLSPGRGKAMSQSDILTGFIRQCRKETDAASKRLGHHVGLSVRVPTRIEGVREWGFDVETWAREGLIDMIIVCNTYSTPDYAMDLSGWKRIISAANPKVRIIPGTDACINSGAVKTFEHSRDFALLRGWAATVAAVSKGEYYFFNAPYFKAEVRNAIYRGELAPDRIVRERRRFPVTYHESMPRRELSDVQLPVALDRAHTIKVNAMKGPFDRHADVVLRLDGFDGEPPAVTLNGISSEGRPRKISAESVTPVPGASKATAYAWRFPIEALRDGFNDVKISCDGRKNAKVTWVEIALDAPPKN